MPDLPKILRRDPQVEMVGGKMSKKPGDWWDESLNPVEGCEPVSEACENCWALAMMRRFRGKGLPKFRTYPRRLEILETWKKPRRIFVGSLTDMLHEQAWPYLMMIIRKAHHFSRHSFVILTKRPHLIEEFKVASGYHASPYTFYEDNIWFGITAENQARLDERVPFLEKHPFKIRFLSLEPLLGPVDLTEALPHVQWVIVGAESGPKARSLHIQWVREIRNQCQAAGIPFWLKSMGRMYRGFQAFSGQHQECMYYCDESNIRLLDGREWSEVPK